MKTGRWHIGFLLIISGLASFGQRAMAVPGDYDGDGRADLVVVDADREGDKTTVFVRLSSDGARNSHVFHAFGNRVISGDFYGNGRTYPGIVSIRGNNRPLEWRIKTPSGDEDVFEFGVKMDRIPNQGDLDCDGQTDFVLVHTEADGTRVWRAKLSGSPGEERTTVFGKLGDMMFTADVDGDGCSEIGAMGLRHVWSSRPFAGGDVTEVKWGVRRDIPLLPADLDGDGVPEYITVHRYGRRLKALIRKADNTDRIVKLGAAGTIPMTGNFLGDNNFAWFDPRNSRFVLMTAKGKFQKVSYGNSRRGILRPDGTEVTEGETGSF
jgi:hypothetical protein